VLPFVGPLPGNGEGEKVLGQVRCLKGLIPKKVIEAVHERKMPFVSHDACPKGVIDDFRNEVIYANIPYCAGKPNFRAVELLHFCGVFNAWESRSRFGVVLRYHPLCLLFALSMM